MCSDSISRLDPARIVLPSASAYIPEPIRAWNRVIFGMAIPRFSAPDTMASPSGCSDPVSAAAASRRSSSSFIPAAGTASVRTGLPFVTVPVLSSTMVVRRCVFSKCSPPLKRMPNSAARPEPAIMLVGVASPSAHGQAMTSTAMNLPIASENCPARLHTYQMRKVSMASPSTIGTKMPEM